MLKKKMSKAMLLVATVGASVGVMTAQTADARTMFYTHHEANGGYASFGDCYKNLLGSLRTIENNGGKPTEYGSYCGKSGSKYHYSYIIYGDSHPAFSYDIVIP